MLICLTFEHILSCAITAMAVYIGGMAGFFLGCSLLSFTEFVYFFSWRVIQNCFK